MTRGVILPALALSWSAPSLAEDGFQASIRREVAAHSQILPTVHVLADVYGPRLTGSPNELSAARWALARLTSYGLVNAHLEAWNFGHEGWVNVRASGRIIAPVNASLTFAPAAWTSATRGLLSREAVKIDPPESPTKAQLEKYLSSIRSEVRGRIVLVGKASVEPLSTRPPLWRLDDRFLTEILDPAKSSQVDEDQPDILTSAEADVAVDQALRSFGAVLRINPSTTEGGLVSAGRNRRFVTRFQIPTITMSDGDYGRIGRFLDERRSVQLAFDIDNRIIPSGRTAYNVLAEIPGTDLADQVVMFGAHLDSWHVATGATDDAVGCAIMMEVARILSALNVRPRRTLRIALWSGEEQGLLGSQDYVARHFGTAEAPQPEFSKLTAYVNIDNGTGRVRAANIFGPPPAASAIRSALQPVFDLGVVGVVPHHVRRLGSTDATTFSRAGLSSIGLIQDPLDYPATHHTSIDTADHVVRDDAEQAAVVVATLLYALGMADGLVPRFSIADMPAPVGPPAQQRPTK